MNTFSQVLQGTLLELWESILAYLPNLVGAIVVFVVGMIIAVILNRFILRLSELLRLDELASRLELKNVFERMGVRLRVGALLAWIVKWFFIIVSLIAATDILGWKEVTDFLKQVVYYIPQVIIAVIILLAGILLGNFVRQILRSTLEAARLAAADVLSGLAKWAIIVFSFMAALVQLNIAPELIQTLFTGLVAALALAGGLAFGLGGRDHASKLLDRLRRDLSSEK
ncbi:MAG: Conserved TM helix repeat-containing protein [Candidatus Uhrbacteria bacterium GW2011_GWA2_53_10]|uniref:Conserved TM helix repeat-containing protein n=1 Tax=Candidatus Uhrbacteria bacterium GW2011_GWA2_53_10 TaxID=1618980 RepID=A0A0G1XPR4_9BACT|nr:MAG: Conserved TM helix repeat-containing protein [Candidatus Uhrbacteria bacterium GW2011_GWA2_53_10]